MYKTRRFKALNGAKGEYSRIVDKIAIYDNNGTQIDCCVIQIDNEGREYYYPSNPNDKYGLFTGKPKDAIECIRNGYGDAFIERNLLGFKAEHVIRFLDREYGEKIRQKTLEGWKDAKFAYGVNFYFKNSFCGGRLVMENKLLMGLEDTKEDVLSFENPEDAEAFIKEVNDKAQSIFEEYLQLQKTGDHNWDYEHTFEPFFNRASSENGGRNSVYWRAFIGINENTGKAGYEMEIVQIVK